MSEIESAIASFLKTWGPLDWHEDVKLPPASCAPYVGTTLHALATIETDSRVMFRKLQVAGLDRDLRMLDFTIAWLGEEAEHGRALRALGHLYGGELVVSSRRDRRATMKNALAWPALAISRAIQPVMMAAYCVLGSMQEHTALTTYRYLATVLEGGAGARTLRAMARQEGRHMRIYRVAAESFLTASAAARAYAPVLVETTWRPVGMDAIGKLAWRQAFGPLISDSGFARRLSAIDSIVVSLPGFQSFPPVMDRFLRVESNSLLAPGQTSASQPIFERALNE